MPARRFPPPWSAEDLDACFVVRYHNGQQLVPMLWQTTGVMIRTVQVRNRVLINNIKQLVEFSPRADHVRLTTGLTSPRVLAKVEFCDLRHCIRASVRENRTGFGGYLGGRTWV
jgi:hypothetical protein